MCHLPLFLKTPLALVTDPTWVFFVFLFIILFSPIIEPCPEPSQLGQGRHIHAFYKIIHNLSSSPF